MSLRASWLAAFVFLVTCGWEYSKAAPTPSPSLAPSPALSPTPDAPASAPTPDAPASAPTPAAPAPLAFADKCPDSVALQYVVETLSKSYPIVNKSKDQPWTFTAQAQLVNHGNEDVKNWQLYIGYQHNEILVSATGVVIADGTQFPASVGNGTILESTSQPDLKTAIETAADMSQISITIPITGTEFGVSPPKYPMPTKINLVGYICKTPTTVGNAMDTCCTKNSSAPVVEEGAPLEKGDITILYDVIQTFTDNYWAQVTISNDNPLGRLDFWNLNWDWHYGEFIYSMKGAETTDQDRSTCLDGEIGTYYKDMDFSQVMSCQSRPTIIDLDQYKANDSTVGRIPYCCRNGTLLPRSMDASESKSVFQLQVYKMPPHNQDRTDIVPPINWNISGTFDASFLCGQPLAVAPSEFPDPSSSQRTESAFMSWQITCNITQSPAIPPRCCVSFSSFYNDSIVPCPTCACGCQSQSSCSKTAEALFIPAEVLSVPFVNRTAKTLAYASLKHLSVPKILPCGDNCGISINWHVLSDYTKGWSARMTIFNWDTMQFADWFAAVELKGTFPGFEQAYSFNGTSNIPGLKNTIFLKGLPGLNYLNGIFEGNPGLQQSTLSFNKKGLSANLVARNFFPSKVIFNGDECALPDIIPTSDAWSATMQTLVAVVIPLLFMIFGPLGLL